MKKVIAIFGLTLISLNGTAQAPDFNDLQILFADGKYEKLAAKSDKYTQSDKTKKEPLPYFWAAKGLYEISLSGSDDPKFKNAYKDAIKYLSKGMKYDKKYNEGNTASDEAEFVAKFQRSLTETITNELSTKGFKKAGSWAIKYIKITNNPVGAKFVIGACKFFDQDKPTAREIWKEGNSMLTKIESIENWSEADKNLLKFGVLYSAKAMKQGRQETQARDLLGKVAQWYENDEEWKENYDEIVN